MKKMKMKLFTHTDLDGAGSAVLAMLMDADTDIQFCENAEVDTAVRRFIDSAEYEKYTDVVIADLSVSPETAEMIDRNAFTEYGDQRFHLLDHHKTAQHLNKYSWAVVAVSIAGVLQSGTQLFYDCISKIFEFDKFNKNSVVDSFVEGVRSWDTWDWKSNEDYYAEKLATLHNEIGLQDFVLNMHTNLSQGRMFSDPNITVIELAQSREWRYIQSMKTRWTPVKYGDLIFAGIIASQYTSKLGNVISSEHPELAGVVILTEFGLSFRTTRDDVDVSEIAKQLGGGGHSKAAGVTLDEKARGALVQQSLSGIFPYMVGADLGTEDFTYSVESS